MCHSSCLVFGATVLTGDVVQGKSIIEVGSFDVNGSLRSIASPFAYAEYLGIDFQEGPGVDEVCDAVDLVARYGRERWDIVLCTEVLEHAEEWRAVISNLKNAAKPGGLILVTTRSLGFPLHANPSDFWRYEVSDMKEIFADCDDAIVESDPEAPGVFVTARKPVDFHETDLESISLFSMQHGRRVADLARPMRIVDESKTVRVGVVIPVRNCLDLTIATIDSIRTQHPYQIFVIDDHSDPPMTSYRSLIHKQAMGLLGIGTLG